MLFLTTTLLLSAGLAASSPLDARDPCGEGPARVCYGINGGTPQNLDVEDVKYVADYLRYLGANGSGSGKFWTMPKAVDCAEWTLPVQDGGSVLALAKHISARTLSSVLYEDLAAAIDGGVGAADGGKNELLGCGANGGMMGVRANLTNPLYSTDAYKKSGAKPDGILIKLVKAPPSKL
ncbi:hypothetical protein NLG97_g9421 [Lecanicillium saksenae]|uniref:Uncharacterized protein n=1 Tax=Lecanicillium saksenae TaxID=468837 RepID=A0ACC1QHJ4_9HYPO|nr:hypothetical protein NLG97_g9421 [Lecanicillium saksenae]